MNRRWKSGFLFVALLALLVSGCGISGSTKTPVEKPVERPVEKVAVKVYFGAHDGERVEPEVHQLNKDALLLQRALEILAGGPKNPALWPVLPATAKIKSVVVKDQTAFADFSAELVTQRLGGSSREILAVAAIVNTLTEFPEVEQVQILVEGKKVSTMFGHIDITEPLSRSPAMIKQ